VALRFTLDLLNVKAPRNEYDRVALRFDMDLVKVRNIRKLDCSGLSMT
jgi:hypothetical protein